MNKRIIGWLAATVFLVGCIALTGRLQNGAKPQEPAQITGLEPFSPGGFTRADGPRDFSFPKDFGPHENFQTEWWYYTGNLSTAAGERFGFELTFFRRGLAGPKDQPLRTSDWGTSQVYLAHFTLTDAGRGKFHVFERFERGSAGLAGAKGEPQFQIWLQDWQVQQTGKRQYHLSAAQEGVSIDLLLDDRKGPILQGDHGYSQKGPQAGNASYYLSQTRLETTGTVEVGGTRYPVSGLSWMDHEFSTSALSKGQIGWDWFSIQLDDGSEFMVYTIRREDGNLDPFSRGTIIAADGSTRPLKQEDFFVKVESTWTSPHSGAVYPSSWTVSIPSENLTLSVRPVLADQELNLSFVYWEGAVRVEAQKNGVKVSGSGYVELTGYSGSFDGEF